MVLFTSRAEINEVFNTFCNTGESNPSDVDSSYFSKPEALPDIEQPVTEITSIATSTDPTIRPSTPVQVCFRF